MEKISALIIDDEVNNIDLLIHFLTQYCPLVEVVGKATTKKEGVELVNKLKPKILFLDIMLDEGTGFDLLEDVEYTKTKVIFITAFDKFAIKAFKYNAIDYVLKPIDIEELVLAVNRAYADIEKEHYTETAQIQQAYKSVTNNSIIPTVIAIPSIENIDFVKIVDIVYLKSEGRYTIFNLNDKRQIVATKNLGEYESLLDGNIFFRIHNSYVVNLNQVNKINKSAGNYCEMSNGESLPIAKRRQDQLNRFLKLK